MLPTRHIITGPWRSITLCTGISGTGYNKRSFRIGKSLHAFVSSACHLGSINIMRFAVTARITIVIMANVIRKRFSGNIHDSRFVHIIPHPFHADFRNQFFEQACPPFANFRVGIIGKITFARPDFAFHERTIGSFTEIIVFQRFLIYPIVFVDFDSGINNDYRFKTVFSQFGYHAFRLRKIFFAPCKAAETFHIIDIQINGITRNAQFSKLSGNFFHLALRIITPFALVVTQSPHRR